MRILSLGYGLPDGLIDNHTWTNAPAFFDYDALVIDPARSVSDIITRILDTGDSHVTSTDEPVQDGPTTDTALGLADLLKERRHEIDFFLSRGGLVICFAYPNVPHSRVAGFSGCHRYYWLAAPEDTDFGTQFLQPATGKHVTATDHEHPFADFLDTLRNNVLYRATIAEGATGFGAALRVIGRSPGGAAIAGDMQTGGGRVLLLPALPPNLAHGERSKIAANLVSAIRNTLLLDADEDPPDWIADYSLPGLEDARRRADTAEGQLEELETEMAVARNEYRALNRFRRLLWQEGKYGLDLPVRDAMEQLGFTPTAKVDDPPSFYYGGETLLVEIEGSIGSVGMNPHYRLRRRLEERIADSGRRAHGVLIVNGQRGSHPSERTEVIEGPLRVASESMRYCIVDATQIYEALKNHLEGIGDSKAFCQSLMTSEGVLERQEAPQSEEPEEEEPEEEHTSDD